ncbi:MAG TPA: ribosome maturation factor RimM [Thermodesulfobacteriota bacterium]
MRLGRLVGIHGLRGELKLRPDNPDSDAVRPGVPLVLEGRGAARDARVVSVRRHKGALLVRFEGVASVNDAEPLVGSRVLIAREDLPRLPEGEFYWFEVIGLEGVTEDGEPLGRVAEILSGPEHDVYVLRDGSRERLVPAVDDVVVAIDPAAGRIVIRPIEGLWES